MLGDRPARATGPRIAPGPRGHTAVRGGTPPVITWRSACGHRGGDERVPRAVRLEGVRAADQLADDRLALVHDDELAVLHLDAVDATGLRVLAEPVEADVV